MESERGIVIVMGAILVTMSLIIWQGHYTECRSRGFSFFYCVTQ